MLTSELIAWNKPSGSSLRGARTRSGMGATSEYSAGDALWNLIEQAQSYRAVSAWTLGTKNLWLDERRNGHTRPPRNAKPGT